MLKLFDNSNDKNVSEDFQFPPQLTLFNFHKFFSCSGFFFRCVGFLFFFFLAMCQPTDLRQLGKWSEGGWVSLTQWGLFGSDGWLMERWLRKRKLAVSIIYLCLFFLMFPKLVAFVIQASQNIIFPYCVMQLLSYFRFIFPTLARQSGGQLQLLRWPRHLFCPSDPIWVLLCACQSHAYEEGGSGLYVVSFKCLIKVSTCCSQTPVPPFTMSFVQFAYIYNIIYIYIYMMVYIYKVYGQCVWKDFISFPLGFFVFLVVGCYLFAFIPLC